jgi:imidazole glycerol-phosphate synthase subunit HisH
MRPVIIDSGGANLASLQYALERLGVEAPVTSAPDEVTKATHVILPGVGSASDAMRRLKTAGIASVLPDLEQPVLGICLGMQLLFTRSEEGETDCLDVIPGSVRRLQAQPGRPVPHMGWNQLSIRQRDPLLERVPENEYVYFVHSYAASVSEDTVAIASYGSEVTAVVRRKNFCGTQFHPERSGAAGARILANFLGIP